MIHTAGQVSGEVCDLVFLAELRDSRWRKWRLDGLRKSCCRGLRFGDENPDVVVVLLAWIAAGVDSFYFQLLIGGERRYEVALPRVGIKFPTMVAAFQPLAVEQAVGKRHTAMGAGIVHREWLILVVATEGKWSFEQHGPAQLLLREFATGRGTIPEAIQHYGFGRLGLWKGLVCHNPE